VDISVPIMTAPAGRGAPSSGYPLVRHPAGLVREPWWPARHNARVGINRTQALVLGFCLAAWVSLVVILVAAPDVYAAALKLGGGGVLASEVAFLLGLSAFLALLGVGVVRRWRWMFWLVLVAFLAGVLRVPASLLELAGVLPAQGPAWYAVFQAAVGLVQFAIGLAMVSGFRRAGVWGAFGR
jgi:hypothetical protein